MVFGAKWFLLGLIYIFSETLAGLVWIVATCAWVFAWLYYAFSVVHSAHEFQSSAGVIGEPAKPPEKSRKL
jgi:hypothetical protein